MLFKNQSVLLKDFSISRRTENPWKGIYHKSILIKEYMAYIAQEYTGRPRPRSCTSAFRPSPGSWGARRGEHRSGQRQQIELPEAPSQYLRAVPIRPSISPASDIPARQCLRYVVTDLKQCSSSARRSRISSCRT